MKEVSHEFFRVLICVKRRNVDTSELEPATADEKVSAMTTDTEAPILRQIHDLVAEEKHLRATHAGHGVSRDERARLEAIERDLDKCWELLRQRRAAEEFGE